jgi:hypothetical protein
MLPKDTLRSQGRAAEEIYHISLREAREEETLAEYFPFCDMIDLGAEEPYRYNNTICSNTTSAPPPQPFFRVPIPSQNSRWSKLSNKPNRDMVDLAEWLSSHPLTPGSPNHASRVSAFRHSCCGD